MRVSWFCYSTKLPEELMAHVIEACDMAIELEHMKQTILTYVQSRMTFIAPNLTIIVGASTAAKLMGVCSVQSYLSQGNYCWSIIVVSIVWQVLLEVWPIWRRCQRAMLWSSGLWRRHCQVSHKPTCCLIPVTFTTQSWFSPCHLYVACTVYPLTHTPHIHKTKSLCDRGQELRRKTARLVAAKAVLAARVDASHESADGKVGSDLLADIEGKLEKLQEPPPVKAVKVSSSISCQCLCNTYRVY